MPVLQPADRGAWNGLRLSITVCLVFCPDYASGDTCVAQGHSHPNCSVIPISSFSNIRGNPCMWLTQLSSAGSSISQEIGPHLPLCLHFWKTLWTVPWNLLPGPSAITLSWQLFFCVFVFCSRISEDILHSMQFYPDSSSGKYLKHGIMFQ